ncbi:MAG TPA: mobile mystery protein A [Candidatus Sulfotelmatobacter sp.]|nr:mobile mystery protein A [Candidatus Sulfotelmatobacter sp.]
MKRTRRAAEYRQNLDARFADMPSPQRLTPPIRGWARAIRDALGMTADQLAKRLKMRQPSVVAIEQSEVKGTVQLATLRKVAAAMNCTLVYALVPDRPLEAIVEERARTLARRRLAAVEHTMLLEKQQLPADDVEARVEALARDIDPRELWDET